MKEFKGGKVIELLSRSNGATIDEITTATGWKEVSVRGFISGPAKRKLGHNVVSTKVDGVRTYKIQPQEVTCAQAQVA